MDANRRNIGMCRLAQLAREGGESNSCLIEYVKDLEVQISKLNATNLSRTWTENERLKLRLLELSGCAGDAPDAKTVSDMTRDDSKV